MFEYLASRWWTTFGRIRRCQVLGVDIYQGFEILKDSCDSQNFLVPPTCWSRCELSQSHSPPLVLTIFCLLSLLFHVDPYDLKGLVWWRNSMQERVVYSLLFFAHFSVVDLCANSIFFKNLILWCGLSVAMIDGYTSNVIRSYYIIFIF